MENLWMLRNVKGDLSRLSRNTNVSEVFLKVLINRGLRTEEDINNFFKGTIDDLYEPYLMDDMEKAVKLTKKAIESGHKIAIYGDYDVDGVSSTVILYKGLKRCGADISYYVPNRETEGYGMSKGGIDKLKDLNIDLIVTCDNGISAIEEIDYASSLGINVILTDHHQPGFIVDENGDEKEVLPNAFAIVNPHKRNCNYPFKYICGAVISYKFVQALYRLFNINDSETKVFIEYATLGTICDVVDLKSENRFIVKQGLKLITNTTEPGLKALIKELGLDNKEIKCYNVGFNIGPCINAAGRLDTANIAIDLFLCDDEKKCSLLAKELVKLNKQRQDITDTSVKKIIDSLKVKEVLPKVLVVYDKDVHESIAGIVAGRIKESFNLPTLVITNGKEMAKGSGRSIEKYNMFYELQKCKDLLYKFGGHPMAAGLSLLEENIEDLRKALNYNTTLTDEDIRPIISIDSVLPSDYNSTYFETQLEEFEPYGKGNVKPLFGLKKAKIIDGTLLGKNKNVLRLNVSYNGKNTQIIIFSDLIDKFYTLLGIKDYTDNSESAILSNMDNVLLDFIVSTDINEYMGRKKVQLIAKDLRLS